MQCIECKSPKTRVIDSRRLKNGTVIRRRRECPNCLNRFTTYELTESFIAKHMMGVMLFD